MERLFNMCKAIEDMIKKAEMDAKRETAKRMIHMGRLTYEEVAECVGLTLEEMVKGMAMCV